MRGVRVCEDVSRELDLHLVRPTSPRASAIRSVYDLGAAGSKRVRSERTSRLLRELGAGSDGRRRRIATLSAGISSGEDAPR